MNRKGQINSFDATFAMLVFILALVFIIAFWFTSISSMQNTISRNRLEYTALSISDVLVKSQGLPSNWEQDPSNTHMLGLATYPNVLSESKLSNFTNLSYSTAKDLLNLDSEEFYFYVEYLNGTRVYESGNSSLTGDNIITVRRFAVLNGTKVRMGLSVYG